MSDTVIKIENLSKQYRLGNVGLGSLSHDVNRWWHTTVRRKEDPYLRIGEENERNTKGTSDYVWALQDINFEMKQGEVLGIIGRNGAGKSTLLKILSRTTTPTTGSVKIKGRVASLLEVGTGFHPELTGRENIFLNGAILGMTKSEIKSKFNEIVDFAGVERYIDTPVKRYSSGMYVRLAFGVAAHLEPEILIVDEVLAVGDAEFQKKALGKMKDVSDKDGRTVLFVSHNMNAIKSLCTKGIHIQNGLLKIEGDINDVLESYGNKDTLVSHKIEWQENDPSAGSESIKMKRIEIRPLFLNQENTIKTNTPIAIEFEFNNYTDEKFCLINFQLQNIENEVLFHIDSKDLKLSKGTYTAICLIPANFLNDGKYKVSRIQFITQHSRLEHRFQEELIFQVDDFRTNMHWHGKWPGKIRPIDFIKFTIK